MKTEFEVFHQLCPVNDRDTKIYEIINEKILLQLFPYDKIYKYQKKKEKKY